MRVFLKSMCLRQIQVTCKLLKDFRRRIWEMVGQIHANHILSIDVKIIVKFEWLGLGKCT